MSLCNICRPNFVQMGPSRFPWDDLRKKLHRGQRMAMVQKKVCYRWQHRAPHVKRETHILVIGVGALGPNLLLRERGNPLPKCWCRSIGRPERNVAYSHVRVKINRPVSPFHPAISDDRSCPISETILRFSNYISICAFSCINQNLEDSRSV